MVKFKKLISIMLVSALTVSAAACTKIDPSVGNGGSGSGSGSGSDFNAEANSQQLQIVKSEVNLPTEDLMLRYKAEYLIRNQGYKDGDEVVAILTLPDDALIDTYLGNSKLSQKQSLADYAKSSAGTLRTNSLANEQTALISELKSRNLISEVEHNYTTIVNAIAVRTTYGKFQKIRKLSSVKQALLAETYLRPQETSTDASAIVNAVDVYTTGIFNSSSVADKGITGKGTSVAVLDSGFDMSHQVFNFEPAGPLMYTRSAIEAKLSTLNAKKTSPNLDVSDVWYSNKIPYSYDYADKDVDVFPYDSEHGTHVAGIIAGKADSYRNKDGSVALDDKGDPIPFRGVAPDSQLVLMKVFPDLSQGANTDDILAAVEDAVLLGVDCINMSLGAACGFAREADGNAINTVYDKVNESGVSLITAAGNEYSSGYGGAQGNTNFVTNPDSGTVGSPSTYVPALSVASINGVKSKYLVGNNSQVVFFNESNSIAGDKNDFFGELYAVQGWDMDGTEHTLEYVTVPGVGERSNYLSVDVKGKIALVRRGTTTFEDKALQAKNAGAVGCIIYNNVDGDILMSMGKTDHIPTISISKEDGTALAQSRSGTFTFSYSNEAGPFMSDFSCWGPLPDLTLKPEITAHGGNIISAVPGGGFDQISGTSMACPNLCGIVVLIRQFLKDQARYEHYDWKDISVLTNQMLMSTANIVLNEQGNPYSPRKQGAGLASLFNVVNTKAYLTVDGIDRTKLNLGDDPDKTGVYKMTFNVVNVSNEAVQYKLDLVGMTESVSTADPDHVAERGQILSGGFTAKVVSGDGTINNGVVTVQADKSVKVEVTYTLTKQDKNIIESLFPHGMYVEGFVKLIASATEEGVAGIDLNIPFLAFYGDWTKAPIFDKTYYEVEAEAHDMGIDEEDKLKADYYATTPYGSYLYNYIIPLGTYLYDVDTTMYDAIPASVEHIAMSDVLGTIDGISAVYAGLLRSCKSMRYTITEKQSGKAVWTHDVTNAGKAFSQGGAPIPNYEYLRMNAFQEGLINNRVYTFTMEGLLDYGDGGAQNNVRNTFTFDFTLDNEAPIIKSATYETVYDRTLKKNRYYVNLTVYDNHHVMAIQPVSIDMYNPSTNSISYTQLTHNPIPVYSKKGADNVVRIEITGFLEELRFDQLSPSTLGFYVDDYALNGNLFLCPLPGTDGNFKFTDDGTEYGAPITFKNMNVGEIVDLTHYLYSSSPNLDAGKDYLKYLDWSSSNTKVVTVREGQAYALATGTVTITVSDRWTNSRATLMVTVRKGSTTLSEAGGEREVVPYSENNVADAGSATASSVRFAYFETVYAHARAGQVSQIGSTGDRIYISSLQGGLSFYPGEIIRLFYDIDPWYVEDKYEIIWSSTNENVAEVTENGVVAAKNKGNATITMRIRHNGVMSNQMATLRVTVNSPFIIDEARTLVAYKGLGGDVVIPDDEGILYIGPYAFSLFETNYNYGSELPEDDFYANRDPAENLTIKSVTVPHGVMEIQQYAFYHCLGLEQVTLSDTVRFLRNYAFYGDDKLVSINLDDVEAIGQYAFTGCEKLQWLTHTSIESENPLDNVLAKTYTIGERAFFNCTALEYVDLSHLRNTGSLAFYGCKSLTSVKMDETGLTKLSVGMFRASGLTSVDIYEKVSIPNMAFAECEALESVTIHNRLEVIGMQAFYGCKSLETVTLPNSAFRVGEGVFHDCEKLHTVVFQADTQLTEIIATLFKNTGVTTFELTDSNYYTLSSDGKFLLSKDGKKVILAAVKQLDEELVLTGYEEIGEGAFSGADIKKVTIQNPAGSTKLQIGAFAFAGCELLEQVILPTDETLQIIIGDRAFMNCFKLASVENLEKATQIGDYAFAVSTDDRNQLTEITIGANTKVGEAAFLSSGVKKVTFLGSVTLGHGAFLSCTRLTTVEMPSEGEVKLSADVFARCTALADIDLSKVDEIPAEAFYGCISLRTVNLEHAKLIGRYAFSDCSALYSVQMPAVERIEEGAFSRNADTGAAPIFTQIVLPETLTYLGEGAFLACESLKSITIPSKVTEIQGYTFAFCLTLKEVTLPDGLTVIGEYAFFADSGLATINLGKVKEVGDYAFTSGPAFNEILYDMGYNSNLSGEISGMETIDLTSMEKIGEAAFAGSIVTGNITANNLVSVGAYAFFKPYDSMYSNGSANVVFPTIITLTAPKLAEIGESAFRGNVSMNAFTFSEDIKFVGPRAFYNTKALANFTFGDGKTEGTINDYAELHDGILYTRMENGKLELNAVPTGKKVTLLSVYEGTYRIGAYAGNANTNVALLTLPDSLAVIGSHAFYGYTSLQSVEFRSVTAPVLENEYVYGEMLNESDPGYEIFESQFVLGYSQQCYFNFIDMVGRNKPIRMVLPANSDISGYDSIIYLVYFGSVENATRSNYVAMEQNIKDFLRYAAEIPAIENIRTRHEALITDAVAALNAIKQNPTAYGITQQEWNELTAKVLAARERIARIKIENASKAVRDAQALIDALPAEYNGSAEHNAMKEEVERAIASLTVADRALLLQDNYTAFVASYDAWKPAATKKGCKNEIGTSISAAAIVAVIAVVAVIGKKKYSSQK